MNSELTAVTAAPTEQPLYHLWGHSSRVRTSVFREAQDQLCAGRDLLDLNSTYISALLASAAAVSDSDIVSGPDAAVIDTRQQHDIWRVAIVLDHWGDAVGAEYWLQRGLRDFRHSLQGLTMWDRLAALRARSHLTRLLNRQGRKDELHVAAVSTIRSCESVLATEGLLLNQCADERSRLGKVLLHTGRVTEAHYHLRASWVTLRELLGDEALLTARAATAVLSVQNSTSAELLRLMRRSVEIAEQVWRWV